MPTSGDGLATAVHDLEPELGRVITAIGQAVAEISADVQSDQIVCNRLRACGAVGIASSEEKPEEIRLGEHGYSVAFDPLDGSSIIDANFAVGSIFGVWPEGRLVGRTGRDQVAAAYAIYGPRTTLVLARPGIGALTPFGAPVVEEFVLGEGGRWTLRRPNIRIGEKKVFAPANLRATSDNPAYSQLLQEVYLAERYTLRYSGGMVPDVHHILAKGGGIFCNPASPSAPPKLRVLYEVAPLAYIVEAAGGESHDGNGSALDREITSTNDRSVVSLGSSALVEMSIGALQGHVPGNVEAVEGVKVMPYGIG